MADCTSRMCKSVRKCANDFGCGLTARPFDDETNQNVWAYVTGRYLSAPIRAIGSMFSNKEPVPEPKGIEDLKVWAQDTGVTLKTTPVGETERTTPMEKLKTLVNERLHRNGYNSENFLGDLEDLERQLRAPSKSEKFLERQSVDWRLDEIVDELSRDDIKPWIDYYLFHVVQ